MSEDWLIQDVSAFHRAAIRQDEPLLKQWCEHAIPRRQKELKEKELMSYALDVLKTVEEKAEALVAKVRAEADAEILKIKTEFEAKLTETEAKLVSLTQHIENTKPLTIAAEELPEFEKHLPAPATLVSAGPAKAV